MSRGRLPRSVQGSSALCSCALAGQHGWRVSEESANEGAETVESQVCNFAVTIPENRSRKILIFAQTCSKTN